MHLSLKLTVFALCCCIAMADISPRKAIETNVLRLLMETRMASRNNPSRSIACVDYYIPLIQELTAQYDKDLRKCDEDARLAKEEVDNSKRDELNAIDATVVGVCERLSSCPAAEKSIPIAECYADAGNDGSRSLYNISKDAVGISNELKNEYRLIEARRNQCTTDTDRAYTEDSTKLNNEMTDCILGITEPPTTVAPNVAY